MLLDAAQMRMRRRMHVRSIDDAVRAVSRRA
jgi:hypothetical protein